MEFQSSTHNRNSSSSNSKIAQSGSDKNVTFSQFKKLKQIMSDSISYDNNDDDDDDDENYSIGWSRR